MSGISFPSSSSGSSHHLQHSQSASAFFPPSFDPSSATSAFQINPLAHHPPRTPRTSIISNSTTYNADTYNNIEEQGENPVYTEERLSVKEDAHSEFGYGQAKPKVRVTEVWKELIATSSGRDKALKLLQYSIRVLLLFQSNVVNGGYSRVLRKPRVESPIEIEAVKRLSSTAAGLSIARKCMILFNWVTPLNTITQPQALPFATAKGIKQPPPKPLLYSFLHAPPPVLLDLVNSLSDDISTFSKLGLLGKRLGERAGRFADWTWFATTLVGLVEVTMERQLVKTLIHDVESRLYSETMTTMTAGSTAGQLADEQELKKLRLQLHWLQISRIKLIMDLIFVSYECFRIKRAKDTVKTFTGLAAAILSSAKLYHRHHTILSKSPTL
ncbi:hypothetical protein SISNIDRAFT_449028 [Sistotremastrum niveocremeum HHB9708]|uniref:Uncharacterized protein n=1 Tax=Sistotremastrum niveocremeum HHB9708 TaxID=1314777 RepID=A0A164Z3S0_9AGAM|nr:hypothetical protein SISNIDRAFT_449028 [Sistotremastrum niveocremeum HHB9708]